MVHGGGAVLDGGIKLKPRQRLIGRGRPRLTNSQGDAVTLARRSVVRGLVIEGPERGGIYGRNVGRVVIRGNDVSGHNTACHPGFHIPSFNVPTTAPGLSVPISEGLHNGWAGIMVDADRGGRQVTIRGNRVHHAECGDGIDVRAFGTAHIRASIARNEVRELRQGEAFESMLAIGLQASDGAVLDARLDRNAQHALGNDEDLGPGPTGADSEGVFLNLSGPSTLRATITRNLYTHVPGRGGFSANGLEFVSMGDGGRGEVTVRDSEFSGTTGDVLEQLALGTNANLRLELERVTARDSEGMGNTFLIPGNNGDCLLAASGGAGNVVDTVVLDSALTGCANNGLTFGSSVANGNGPTKSLRLYVAGSTITGNRGNNLRVGNVTALDALEVTVLSTDLSNGGGTGSLTPANASFENIGSTARAAISVADSCLDGGGLAAALIRYDVMARGNWWGAPGRVLAVGGALDDAEPLAARPACGR